MLKKILLTVLLIILFTTIPVLASVQVELDGQMLTFDVSPINENGRVLVPLRAIFEALGAGVEWDSNTQTVTATKGDTIVQLTIGDQNAYINGTKITLDVAGKMINGRTMVPLRFISESMGCKVSWDGTKELITITSNNAAETKNTKKVSEILSSLKTLIYSSDNNTLVTNHFKLVQSKLENQEIIVYIDPNLKRDIMEGIRFIPAQQGIEKPIIAISPFLIEIYDNQPSIVYSVLIHEYQHAYSFYADKESFVLGASDELEKYLYEMDAYYLESLFIKHWLIKNNYELTPFEQFISESLDANDLTSFSVALLGLNKDVVYDLYKTANSNEIRKEQKISMIKDIGDESLKSDTTLNDAVTWENYYVLITMYSYFKFVPRYVDVNANPEILEQLKKIESIYNKYPETLLLNKTYIEEFKKF